MDSLGMSLVKVIELLVREVEEFAPFIVVNLWVCVGASS